MHILKLEILLSFALSLLPVQKAIEINHILGTPTELQKHIYNGKSQVYPPKTQAKASITVTCMTIFIELEGCKQHYYTLFQNINIFLPQLTFYSETFSSSQFHQKHPPGHPHLPLHNENDEVTELYFVTAGRFWGIQLFLPLPLGDPSQSFESIHYARQKCFHLGKIEVRCFLPGNSCIWCHHPLKSFSCFSSETKSRCYTSRNITPSLPAGPSSTEILQAGAKMLSFLKMKIPLPTMTIHTILISQIISKFQPGLQLTEWLSSTFLLLSTQ